MIVDDVQDCIDDGCGQRKLLRRVAETRGVYDEIYLDRLLYTPLHGLFNDRI